MGLTGDRGGQNKSGRGATHGKILHQGAYRTQQAAQSHIGAYESQRTCAADYTGDGSYDFADVLEFLARFGAGDPFADIAPAFGEFDFNDVLAFLTGFGAGCP